MEKQIRCNEDEYGKLIKILDFRLPHIFKKIGLISALLIFIYLFASKFIGSDALIVKDVLRTLVLFFMLVASLSKDSFEDEFNKHVRFQSYVIAFVFAAGYYIFIPIISVILDMVITKITGDGSVSFHGGSSFEVLFVLLGTQILFFHALKRFGRAQ